MSTLSSSEDSKRTSIPASPRRLSLSPTDPKLLPRSDHIELPAHIRSKERIGVVMNRPINFVKRGGFGILSPMKITHTD